MVKGKVRGMHVKSMAGGHTLRVEREPESGEANSPMMDNQPEESMHPEGSPGAQHIAGLMKAHEGAMKSKPARKSASMPAEAMQKAFGR